MVKKLAARVVRGKKLDKNLNRMIALVSSEMVAAYKLRSNICDRKEK
jgi:hypothetical protein